MARLVETKQAIVDQEKITDDSELNTAAITSFGWKQFFYAILVPFFVTRFLLILAAILTAKYIYPLIDKKQSILVSPDRLHFPTIIWSIWNRFDSGFISVLLRADTGERIRYTV